MRSYTLVILLLVTTACAQSEPGPTTVPLSPDATELAQVEPDAPIATTQAPTTTTQPPSFLPATLELRESLLGAFQANAYVIRHSITDSLGDSTEQISSESSLQLDPPVGSVTHHAPDGSYAALGTPTISWHLRDDGLWITGERVQQFSQFVPYEKSDRDFVMDSVLTSLTEEDLASSFEAHGSSVQRYVIEDDRLLIAASATVARFVVDVADNGIVVRYEGHIETAMGLTRDTQWEVLELSPAVLLTEPSAEERHPAWREVLTLESFNEVYSAIERLRGRDDRWVTDVDAINAELDVYDISVVGVLGEALPDTPGFELFGNDLVIAAPTGGGTWVCLQLSGSDDPNRGGTFRYSMAEDVSSLDSPSECNAFAIVEELVESMSK